MAKKKEKKSIPDCPSCLGAVARAEWKILVTDLDALGILDRVDRGALVVYCEAWEEFIISGEVVKKEGTVSYAQNGTPFQHPALGTKNKAAERMLKVAAQFGMTPAARVKIDACDSDVTNSFAEFAGLKAVK